MATQEVKVNLTIPFVIWTLIFIVLGLLTGATWLFWLAALPWLLTLGFVIFVLVVVGIAGVFGFRR